MAAFTNLANYLQLRERGIATPVYKSLGVSSGFWGSAWTVAPNAGAIPSTAVACNAATVGALNFEQGTFTGQRFLTSFDGSSAWVHQSCFLLYDRLAHQGGLSGTVTTEQTTNLPTAALTRYTGGVGVMILIEIYSAVGSTATTLTARYTNSAGTGSRTTKEVVFGGTNNNAANRAFMLPLQDGDLGAKSVEGVTVLASTLTAGNFGVTLLKPIGFHVGLGLPQCSDYGGTIDSVLDQCSIPEVISNACLGVLYTGGTVSTGPVGAYMIAET